MPAALLNPAAPATSPGWQATLDLRFEQRATQGTVLAHARHSGPLRVQKPLHPEGPGICHAVLLHPPGGVAGGDQLHIQVDLAPGAHALLTTPGATRWYKSMGRPAAQRVRLDVAEGATLEWLPQENMLFAGAEARMALDLHLAPGARAIGWDAVVLGRYGAGEHWHTAGPETPASLSLHNRLLWDGMPLWLEQGHLQAGDALLASPVAWAGFPIQASLWAVAPGCTEALAERLATDLPWTPGVRAGASLLSGPPGAPSVLLLRVLARRMQEARSVLHQAWRLLRPALLDQPARPPRLWAT
ncbi:MAG: urease accessory protein UreD [Burkholderiaceae bacterium]|jgi:urease accessory protein|nr:urease accessory protein UreD [Burkholderiaceae bacterium]